MGVVKINQQNVMFTPLLCLLTFPFNLFLKNTLFYLLKKEWINKEE